MFKIKAKIKDEILVKDGMYFRYGLTIFKLSKIIDGWVKVGYYDEPSGVSHTIGDPYSVSFLQAAILEGNYVVIQPGYEFTIPEKFRDYVVEHKDKT